MSLTQSDLQKIEDVFDRKLDPVLGELEALKNDIKEIYNMLAELQSGVITDKNFKKLSIEEKLLTLNSELLSAATQAGITFPR